MEPFKSFTGRVRVGAWLKNIHDLHDTDEQRVNAALNNLKPPAKKIIEEIADALEARQLKMWKWSWAALQKAMFYVEKEERRRHENKTFVGNLVALPGKHPVAYRAISFTAKAVSIGGVIAPVALGATGIASIGVVRAAAAWNAQIVGVAQGTALSVLKKVGMASVAKGVYDSVNDVSNMLGITTADIVPQGPELREGVEPVVPYGKDETLLDMLCAIGGDTGKGVRNTASRIWHSTKHAHPSRMQSERNGPSQQTTQERRRSSRSFRLLKLTVSVFCILSAGILTTLYFGLGHL